jgi:hypothetical protein
MNCEGKTTKAKVCASCLRVIHGAGWKLAGYRGAICARCVSTRGVTSEVMKMLFSLRTRNVTQSRRIKELNQKLYFYRTLFRGNACRCGRKRSRSPEEVEKQLAELDAKIERGEL